MTKKNCLDLITWLLDTAILIYASTKRKNDFFLLHGVTASWSLRQVAPHLEPEVAYTCFRSFVPGLLATYLAQNAEEIVPLNMETSGSEAEWERLIADVVSDDKDEHVFKLVQVCRERWLETRGEGNEGVFYAAAKVASECPLTF